MKDGQWGSLLPTQTLADILGAQAPFALRAGEKGLSHTPPAEQPPHPSWWAGSPSTLQFLARSPPPADPGDGVDLVQGVSVGFPHCHCHADWRPAQGAAKPGTGAGGGKEGWEVFSPGSTAEANVLCNLILQG